MDKTRIALLALAFAAAQPLTVAPAQADDQSNHGRDLFMANNCYQCHGRVGQGGAGPTLAPPHLMSQSD
ncbi:MAG TPA: c-type cytochrome, partial [Stellaceae bacterium]|nr:c-type cytochrome [Stellaceae bacterium]